MMLVAMTLGVGCLAFDFRAGLLFFCWVLGSAESCRNWVKLADTVSHAQQATTDELDLTNMFELLENPAIALVSRQ
jgi:hypothetical protein